MDIWYYIYRSRKLENGSWGHTELGRTRFKVDAQSILKNWHSGYIVCNGEIIERKNVEF